ncbi:S8 family peptidase [Pedobacter endophyticus]|uniref:S8 family peptidase n=1 Tax=Pedobacter endophyticus TaxID=2789740 RepID=A0A7S9L1R9_9SPHI|nr:S8 family peptidase [Pedobacter endophyticus]QPH40920.1 S8 family peptidase [Pedobacter endophyticus]
MARQNPKKHIKLDGFAQSLDYAYPKKTFSGNLDLAQRNRNQHGNRILAQLDAIRQRFDIPVEVDLPEGILRDEAVYVEFTSEWGYKLDFNSMDQDKTDPLFQILNIREEQEDVEENHRFRYHVTMMMTQGGISNFIEKIRLYINENIFRKDKITGERVDTGNAKYYKLFLNIESIQSATLKSFWADEPEIDFPDENEDLWWEVWFRKTGNDQFRIARVLENLALTGVQVGQSELVFAEHRVRLVKGTAIQLSRSIMLLDNLSELRKPQETADFICHKDQDYQDHAEWMSELLERTDVEINGNSVLICLLDSGVNNAHPLIQPFLPDAHMGSFKPDDWGTGDDWPNGGHGTGVAGLTLYGDMVDALNEPGRIRILHGLESFKIINQADANDPELYGAITEYATSTPLVDRPENPRVFCMTITDKEFAFKGRPSAWSAAIDKIAFGSALEPVAPQLVIVSSGNVITENHDDYPDLNLRESIHDPAQAYNAVTVGSYTRKDRIDPATGHIHLAPNGAMSPSNSTSTLWESQWPIKPDIVMEGGNCSTDGVYVSDHYDLKMLTADRDFPSYTFMPFGDTSGAAGLAAKMAAELRTFYPEFWPETIRALMVHAADWTAGMLNNRSFEALNETDRKLLLRSVGYGVPILENALYSANNSLTLIAEREIQPYHLVSSVGKSREYHLYDLPWPEDVLLNQLFDQDVTLKITLSYFIEPNPGSKNKRYVNNFHYHSHALEFAVIKENEPLEMFKRRISKASELEDDQIDRTEEKWSIKRVRSRGSIKKDFVTMSGADMSARNKIAIYPKPGWYRSRKKLGKTDSIVRYSLIVTLETANVEIDLMTPVLNQLGALPV